MQPTRTVILGQKRVKGKLRASELTAVSIYCIMHDGSLGLLLHDSTLRVLCEIYNRNCIHFIPFGTQRNVKVSSKAQFCGCARQTAAFVYVKNLSSTQADSHSPIIKGSKSRAQNRNDFSFNRRQILN